MKLRPRIGLAFVAVSGLVAFFPGPAIAATNLIGESPSFARALDPMTSLLRVVGGLLLVLALLIGGALYFKKSKFFAQYHSASARLRILETRSLGLKSNLLVVGYERNRYLLSISPTGVQLLTALPEASSEESGSPGGASFEERLKSAEEKRS